MFLKLPVDNGETVLIALDKIIYIEKYEYKEDKTSISLVGDEIIVVDVDYDRIVKFIESGSCVEVSNYD